ncbi:tyrosine-type recombinase/integrase [Caballeronia sp. EK]|uniref:tyrosine-type recombinase/integrase n=1 Tax=Caballeronia sp. EK TaxID=2767469 RepID=UPI001655759B|nr:tyrosine-type recombinase/integrase [Caballeronia sp. EK]MBC8640188.1 tyrosine-type recombinase/integrase [Caballeronia sp. EK]
MLTLENGRSALSRKAVFTLAARTPGRYTDAEFPTLGLQVSPKGRAVWFARGKAPGGKEFRHTLGLAATEGDGLISFSYEQAREWALSTLRAAHRPPEPKPQDDPYATLAGVWPMFIENRRTKKGQPLAASTKKDYQKWFDVALKPVHDWRLADTRALAWVEFFSAVREKHGASKALYMSNIMSSVYSFLMSLDQLDSNPIIKVRLGRLFIAPKPRTSHIEVADLRAFWAAVGRTLKRRDSRDAVRLLFLSGLRLNAALGLRWGQLDLAKGFAYIEPGTEGWKGFSGVFPLSDYVVDLLRVRYVSRKSREWVFPKRVGDPEEGSPHLSRVGDSLTKVCDAAGIERVTAHDLRRTLATVGDLAFGADHSKVAVLLGHNWATNEKGMTVSRGAITARYIQTELATLRAIANEAGRTLLELCGELPLTDETAAKLRRAGLTI